jgi:AraC-like DNA-binding protein
LYGQTKLYQIGRLYSKPTTVVEDHVQKAFELTIVNDGYGVISTNGVPLKVERGDIYLSFPCEIHKIESDSEKPLKYDFFAFDTENAELKNELERIMAEYSGAERRVFCDERINFLVGNAIAEIHRSNFGHLKLLESVFSQIMIYVVRAFCPAADDGDIGRVSGAEALCFKIMNYVDTHVYSIKKLDELADVTGYSYGYLSALFKKVTSNTIADYYRNKRLEIARLLVLEKKLKIGEVAEMLNYASVYAFSKAFKNRFGASPEKYVIQQERT